MQVKPTVPEVALRPYTTGSLTVQLQNIRPGIQDTLRLQDYRLIYQKKLKIRPKSTLQSHHARQRQAVHGSRPEQNPDQPEQTGRIPLGKPQRHASRFAARTRYARCGNSRRFRLSAGGGARK
ncbi:MAG: hypothetical protein ACLTZY_14760 [Alistipes indistinctus]